MSYQLDATVVRRASTGVQNKVLKNTFLLLALSMLCAAGTSWVSYTHNFAPPGLIVWIAGWFGLLFLIQALRNSAWGIAAVFAFTGFTGLMLGPIINVYLHAYVNGAAIVTGAFAGTGGIFLGLTLYALISREDFSYLTGAMMVMMPGLFIAVIVGLFLSATWLNLLISCGFILFSSMMILWQISAIVNEGETNYIMATVNLYISLFNLFLSLLQILGALSGNRN